MTLFRLNDSHSVELSKLENLYIWKAEDGTFDFCYTANGRPYLLDKYKTFEEAVRAKEEIEEMLCYSSFRQSLSNPNPPSKSPPPFDGTVIPDRHKVTVAEPKKSKWAWFNWYL